MNEGPVDFGASWETFWAGLGAEGDGQPLRDRLLDHYGEGQRRYHGLQHLGECLRALAVYKDEAERPHELACGLWFHDAIYDPTRSDNEERSADWAARALTTAGVASAAARVHALVMATCHAGVPATRDESLLVDIDLGILAAPAARFREYEQQIREEYAFVPEDLFRAKRKEILRSFLDRPSIYFSATLRAAHEAAARENLERALRSLDGEA